MSGSLTLEGCKAKVQGKSSIENCNSQSPRNFSTLQSFVRVLCSLQQWILFLLQLLRTDCKYYAI